MSKFYAVVHQDGTKEVVPADWPATEGWLNVTDIKGVIKPVSTEAAGFSALAARMRELEKVEPTTPSPLSPPERDPSDTAQ